MKENDFIKKYGLGEAVKLVNSVKFVVTIKGVVIEPCFIIEDCALSYKELKHLVESLELVEFVGGDLDGAKRFCEFAEDMKYLQKRGRLILVEDVRKAILDVESCQ